MAANYHFRNLVFEGGGVKGIAYLGALEALEGQGVLGRIRRVGGTSAGAINAVLFALGYSIEETEEVLWSLDFNNFMDDSWGLVRDTQRLVNEFGWYRGDFFYDWMGTLIARKTGNRFATFADLAQQGRKDLFLVGTNLSTGFSEVFSHEHTPLMRVVDAARISMSIPLFFRAIRNPRDDVYVDGGLLRNYPVKLFDRKHYLEKPRKHAVRTDYYERCNRHRPPGTSTYCNNKETLGFRLDAREEIAMFRDGAEPPVTAVGDFFDYTLAMLRAVMNVQSNLHLHSDDWQRTVYIDSLGVGTTDFDLTDERKRELVEAGRKGVTDYFDWYDHVPGDALPNNHPDFRPD